VGSSNSTTLGGRGEEKVKVTSRWKSVRSPKIPMDRLSITWTEGGGGKGSVPNFLKGGGFGADLT